MKNPQTYCLTVKKTLSPERLETIHKHGCCAFVLLWCLGIEPEDLNAIELVSDMIDAKVIESDCTVHWKEAVKFLTGREITIQFQDIKDILKIKERPPVRYDYKGKCHWVGVERGMIVFNPLKFSQCVNYGRPVTARIIKLK